MEPRRQKKRTVLTIPKSQWTYRKNRLVNPKVKAIGKRIKHG